MGQTRQLDLFSDTPAVIPPAAPAPAPTPPSTEEPAFVATTRPPTLPQNARWREVTTPAQTIGFVLRRSRRKSIGLTINDDGLQVTAPNWVTLGQIDEAVVEKANWILAKLGALRARQKHLATADTLWQQGGSLPYLGRRVVLELNGAGRTTAFSGSPFMPRDGDTLVLALPRDADRDRIRDSVHAWLQQQAATWFDQRLRHFLDTNGLAIRRWRLSSAATRWGSCSSDGNIMLNWRLIHFDHGVIDYVIAHELAHLREMNHSKDFWREVGRILPGFEHARDVLRQHNPGSLPLI
ncbi:MAG: SprT family zinc-dependent metalloprotease [Burkholderiaceae bacterium]